MRSPGVAVAGPDRIAVDEELALLGAILVEGRVLRRVIKRHRKIRSVGLHVPHEQCYTLSRTELERIVEPGEVAVDLATLSERVIVVAGDRRRLTASLPEAQTRLWRAVFHARVHQRLDELLARQQLTPAVIRDRTSRIGQMQFQEIRSVLMQADLLLPPIDPIATYVEFVALYLELKYFAPRAVEHTFPAFDTRTVDATVELDLDPRSLLAESRPPRAPAQPMIAVPAEPERSVDPPDQASADPSESRGAGAARADRAAAAARAKGNRARAGILAARAGDLRAARHDLDALSARLSQALGGVPAAGWTDALLPVARFAARRRSRRFSAGARLLHDLQSACVIAEREETVVDVITWALSRGTQPVVRPLPATREIRIAKRVRAAEAKVAACDLGSGDERDRLAAVLHAMTNDAEDRVRVVLHPRVEAALDEVGLRPSGLPERVAQKKLIQELLDRAVAVGRLSLPALRDAISRNDLKMSDLELSQLRTGDQLLRTDRILATSLDGVYRRGEGYLRLLQKVSSVLFGTRLGRALTLYALLPLLSSFVIVEGLQHMVGPVAEYLVGVEPAISTGASLLGGAAFLFLLLHVQPFRRAVVLLSRGTGKLLRWILIDLPIAIWCDPLTEGILASRPVRWGVKPAIPALLPVWLGPETLRWVMAVGLFIGTAITLNSRRGRLAEEIAADWIVRTSRQVTSRIVPGLVKYTLELFAKLLELVERAIYRVDEWLRFRRGQSVIMLAIKGVLGAWWFLTTYFLRLYVNLLVEPTINPIKHFPVVTAAAKISLPFLPLLLSAIAAPATQLMGPAVGNSFAAFTVLMLPGLAGFLAWELKENWKLYRATRPRMLRPLAIGHHGETMASFLVPGFRSGTIPKLFTKMRRTAWRGDERAIARHKEALHDVEGAIATFVERQLVSMLNEVHAFPATDVALRGAEIGSNRVRISLVCPSVSSDVAEIQFQQQAGWLVASLPAPGWIHRLSDADRRIVEIALTGFYRLSGVHLAREQLDEVLRQGSDPPPRYDITDEGLVVWLGQGFESVVVYDLRKAKLKPRVRGTPPGGDVVDLRGRHVVFGREPVSWAIWSTTWSAIARGYKPTRIANGPSLLPC